MTRAFSSPEAAWDYAAAAFGIERACRHPDCPKLTVYYDPLQPERVVLLKGIPVLRTLGWHFVYIGGLGVLVLGCLLGMRCPVAGRFGRRASGGAAEED